MIRQAGFLGLLLLGLLMPAWGEELPDLTFCATAEWVVTHPSPDATRFECKVPVSDWTQAIRYARQRDTFGQRLQTLAFVVDGMGGELRWNQPHPSKGITGGVLLHQGGGGTLWGETFRSVWGDLEEAGVRVVGVRWERSGVDVLQDAVTGWWLPVTGWLTRPDANPSSFILLSRRPGAVIKWVRLYLVPATVKFGTAGCSGGAVATFAPTYWHGLSAYLDYQWLSGGPFGWDLNKGCSVPTPPGVCEKEPLMDCESDVECPCQRCALPGVPDILKPVVDYVFVSGTDCQDGRWNEAFAASSYSGSPGEWERTYPIDFVHNTRGDRGDSNVGITYDAAHVFRQLESPLKTWTIHENLSHCGSWLSDETRAMILRGLGLKDRR